MNRDANILWFQNYKQFFIEKNEGNYRIFIASFKNIAILHTVLLNKHGRYLVLQTAASTLKLYMWKRSITEKQNLFHALLGGDYEEAILVVTIVSPFMFLALQM